MGDVAGDDQGAGEGEAGLDGVLGQLGQDVVHGAVEVDGHRVEVRARALGQLVVRRLREETGRVGLQLLQEDALGGDLRDGLAVGGAGDRDGDRAGRAVTGQADDADIMAEVLAAELGADADLLRQLEDLLLQLLVPEPVAGGEPSAGSSSR